MSAPTIAPYYPFRRIKITEQSVTPDAEAAHIQMKPDKRFTPICHECGHRATGVHSWAVRRLRDLNMANVQVWVTCRYRKIFCGNCHSIHIEDLERFGSGLEIHDHDVGFFSRVVTKMNIPAGFPAFVFAEHR